MRLVGAIALLAPATALAQPVGDPARGQAIAAGICAACHAVAPGEGLAPEPLTLPWPQGVALAFEDIANTRGISEAVLHVWLTTSHPTMPDLVLSPEEVEDVSAYILSLRTQGP